MFKTPLTNLVVVIFIMALPFLLLWLGFKLLTKTIKDLEK